MIVKDGDSRVVQFSLFSVKEFLTADRLAEPIRDVSRYHIRLGAAHTILVRACLGVFLQLDDRIDRGSMKNLPLAQYAVDYWVAHVSSQVKEMKTNHTLQRGFGSKTKTEGSSMSTMRPEKPEAVSLYYAAMLRFRDCAEHLLAKHPEHVNARGGREMTPIHVASLVGLSDMLTFLIEHGADVNGRGNG
jgi:hypothetical protein